ncbi:MAG TPA: serine hydrolase domain-containing protein [Kofleriaceae bacterium]|nr:serine hydrolase domain-containing protein [Kofleriaceae bacterium]
MTAIAALIETALAGGLGSAAALSVGDAGREIVRLTRGTTRRVPTPGAPVDDATPFDVASLTKPMATAALAMVLAGDGALDLEAPVRRWFPAAATAGTVRHLLGHAAGCVAHVEFFRFLPPGSYAELIARAAGHPAGPPGVATVYSDLGYLLLGAILERVADAPLADAVRSAVTEPLGLGGARYPGQARLVGAVATELTDARGLVEGLVHDENAHAGGGVCGHAGLFATIDDVARFAAAFIATAHGAPRGRWRPDVVQRFVTTAAAPATTWRLGWDTPSTQPGVSHAGDRWPRDGSIGHTGFTGTSLWLDLPRRRWVALLTNRVHPTRGGDSADAIKALRRAVGDAACDLVASEDNSDGSVEVHGEPAEQATRHS